MSSLLSQAQQAWQQVLGQLRYTLNRADFDAWLRDARPLNYDGQVLTVGVANAYARDWLADRLRTTLENQLRGLLGAPVQVVFVVAAPDTTPPLDTTPPSENPQPSGTTVPQAQANEPSPPPTPMPASVDLRAVSLRLRDAFQRPRRIVFLPGYFLRWLPYLGSRAAWLYVALRQTHFLANRHPYGPGQPIRPGQALEVPRHTLARWSHLTKRTINNILNQGLLAPLVQVERDRHLDAHRQAPNRYIFTTDMPLTPHDLESVLAFLEAHNLKEDPIAALAAALQQPPQNLLAPLPSPPPAPPAQPPSLRAALSERLRPLALPQATLAKALGMGELLETSLIEAEGKLFIPWYFIEHHLPALGHTVAWLYLVARHRAEREGRAAGNGFRTLEATARRVAGWLGLKKARYGRDLIPVAALDTPAAAPPEGESIPPAAFLRRPPGRGNTFTLAVQTVLPLTPADEAAHRLALQALAACAQQGDFTPLHRLQEACRHKDTTVAEEALHTLTNVEAPPEIRRRALEALAELPEISPGVPQQSSPEGQKFPPETPKVSSGSAKTFLPRGQNLPAESAKTFPHVNLNHPQATSGQPKEHPPAQAGGEISTAWRWEDLPAWQNLAPAVQKALLRFPAWHGVAWLLYVAAHDTRLEAPLGFAVHKIRQGGLPGGAFDALARLPKEQIRALLARHLEYGPEAVMAVEPRWQVFGKAGRQAMLALAGWLGVDFV
ncbi:MAG TPA: hypothetical protein ENJ54_01545 [Chloroflexi bacterium]|nr:hypothetical protein [Chloroflexota bacterium]